MTNREKLRKRFLKLIEDAALSTADVAAMLYSSIARINSWRRTEGAAGANPVPMWAIELLEFKIAAMVAAAKDREDK